MSIRKFEKDDVFVNILKTKPHSKFSIFNGQINYRADFANTVPKGHTAINDLNLVEPTTGEAIVGLYSLDFSIPENSEYIPLI
jgi:hypothetical protein